MKKFLYAALIVFALGFISCGAASADEALANSMTTGTWTANPRYITFGEYNGHALKWRVLEVYGDKTAFLVLDDVLREDGGDPLIMTFDSDGESIGNNFPASEIFTFLNDTFLPNLADYLGGILTAKYGPDTNDNYTWNGGPSELSSQVFLLSTEEAMNHDYFKDDLDRNVNEYYWLRSPGLNRYGAAFVGSGGDVDSIGAYVDLTRLAVRPALKINLASDVFTSDLVSYPPEKESEPK